MTYLYQALEQGVKGTLSIARMIILKIKLKRASAYIQQAYDYYQAVEHQKGQCRLKSNDTGAIDFVETLSFY